MSRTWKDRPLRVKLHENMKKGLIDHEHLEFSKEAVARVSSYADRFLTKVFYKSEPKAIRAYCEELDELVETGFVSHYELEEIPGKLEYIPLHEWLDRRWEKKTVHIKVYRRYLYQHQTLCTDYEHYDSLTKTDKRNGIRAACTPTWTDDLWPRKRHRNKPARSQVKQTLHEAKLLANNGELTDGYSEVILEEEYGKKLWTWDD